MPAKSPGVPTSWPVVSFGGAAFSSRGQRGRRGTPTLARVIPRSVLEAFCAKRLKGEKNMSEPTKEELMARISELEQQVVLKRSGTLQFKVGEKGGVSVYGLGRFPVTLYYEQWVRLLDAAGDIRTFLEENKSRLKLKTKE
jgi:hypothetical protein